MKLRGKSLDINGKASAEQMGPAVDNGEIGGI